MRALLIDPFAQTVTETDGDFSNIDNIYRAIDAQPLDAVRMEGFDIFVDDEGLFWHTVILMTAPIAGKGLVVSCNDEGETAACPDWLTADTLRRNMIFCEMIDKGFDLDKTA